MKVLIESLNGEPSIDGWRCTYASFEIRNIVESIFSASGEGIFVLPENLTYTTLYRTNWMGQRIQIKKVCWKRKPKTDVTIESLMNILMN